MADENKLIIPLSKAYPSHNGDFQKLELREPTARDYLQIPLPLRQITRKDGSKENSLDFELMFRWVSRLGTIEISLLEKFNKADTWAVAGVIGGWIGADGDESEVDEKNSEG